jgi:predicted AAA+ superfamily ATPase
LKVAIRAAALSRKKRSTLLGQNRAFSMVRDNLPQLAMGVAGATMRRFWTMLAHHHGQVLNLSMLSRALGVSDTSVRAYVDSLAGTFVVRVLQPWHENVGKRQVKRPKVYISDTGILHALLGLETREEIEGHPILGMSWEWFAHRRVVAALGARPEQCFFWATHAGAELDLLVVRGGRRLGFEFQRTDSPRRTRSMHAARTTLGLDSLDVVHAGEHSFPLGDGIQATSISRVSEEIGAVR